MAKTFISRKTMTEFREYMVGWVLREIDDEFTSAGIVAAESTSVPVKSGARRQQVELYYASLDLTDGGDARKLLDVFENVLINARAMNSDYGTGLENWLVKDGYYFEDNRILARGATAAKHLAAKVEAVDARRVHDDIRRMEDAVEDDAALAIGSAKELVESICKTILDAKSIQIAKDADLSVLVKTTTKTLKLAPEDIPDATRGADAVKKTLHNLAAIVGNIAELRNLYGTGHGKSGKTRGLQSRHARLVVGAASALVTFLWDTFADRDA